MLLAPKTTFREALAIDGTCVLLGGSGTVLAPAARTVAVRPDGDVDRGGVFKQGDLPGVSTPWKKGNRLVYPLVGFVCSPHA